MQPNSKREILWYNLSNVRRGLQFFHKMIIVHIMYLVIKILNAVPTRLGISQEHAPAKIMMGQKLDAKKDLQVRFGAYIEASCDPIITNAMTDRTHT